MTRFFAILLAAGSLCACVRAGERAPDDDILPGHEWSSLDAARELDQQGVRSFRDGHYADAVNYFRAARGLGGPSTELWNIARCEERLDDGEAASAALDEYLAQADLSPLDRAEGERESKTLRTRSSTLTVTTTPPGASIAIDAQPETRSTPSSLEVSAGLHTVTIRHPGFLPQTQSIEARFGRAIIVALYLVRSDK